MDLHKTDPEFTERFEYFAFHEAPNEEGQQLPEKNALYGNLSGSYRLRRRGRIQGNAAESA